MTDFHEIFEKIPDGVTLHDADDGAILETNEQFCNMLGYTREELLNLEFEDLHVDEPPYTSERAEEYIRKATSEGPQTFEWLDQTKHGEPLPVEVNLDLTTIGGEERILAVVRDITERKRQEQELERQNERLNEFASIVSHDLQNPLRVAEGHLELAREETNSKHLDGVARALDRMNELVNNLYSLASGGQDIDETKPVEIAGLAEKCWQTVETDSATLDIQADRTIYADPSRLRQLIENLYSNAVVHGGPEVTVTIGDLSDGFFLEDDGVGIPESEETAVFETGYSTAQEGRGYGLKIVREIANAHDWGVELMTSEDDGARFEFTSVDVKS